MGHSNIRDRASPALLTLSNEPNLRMTSQWIRQADEMPAQRSKLLETHHIRCGPHRIARRTRLTIGQQGGKRRGKAGAKN